MDYKNGKWAKKIIELQHDDGSWGYFHSLSNPTPKQPITTEILDFFYKFQVKFHIFPLECLFSSNTILYLYFL